MWEGGKTATSFLDLLYPCNDTYHFILHLFFVPYVLPHQGWSFNAPVWSVSLELIAYVVFFVFARWFKPTVFKVGCMAAVFALLKPWPAAFPSGKEINQCLFFFFSGGCVFLSLRMFSRYLHAFIVWILLVVLVWVLCSSTMAAVLCARFGLHYLSGWVLFLVLLASFPFPLPGRFPFLCTQLGNLTYAIYMLHVSSQFYSKCPLADKHGRFSRFSMVFFLLSCCRLGRCGMGIPVF